MLYDRPIQDSFDVRFEPTHQDASSTRGDARRLLDAAGVQPAVAADLELIIAELTSNAVEQRPESPVHLVLTIEPGRIVVTVANQISGDDRPDPSRGAPDPAADDLAERGWGLAIVENLSDDLTVERGDGWTTVRALRRYGTSVPDERG